MSASFPTRSGTDMLPIEREFNVPTEDPRIETQLTDGDLEPGSVQLEDDDVMSSSDDWTHDETPEDGLIFGTFFIDDNEFTFPAGLIREVVSYPQRLTPIPLCPTYVLGMFNLRGDLIPVVDIAEILGITSDRPIEARQVAVIDCGSSLVGALFDRTGEVRRVVRPQQFHRVDHTDGENAIVEGVIQFEEDARLVQQLSPMLLGAVNRVPKPNGVHRSAAMAAEPTVEKRRAAIVVRLGPNEFAFDMESVLEIQSPMPVKDCPAYFHQCVGVVQLRDEVVPVLDLLGLIGQTACGVYDDKRLVFVLYGDTRCAIPVDQVVDTLQFADNQLLPFPQLSRSSMGDLCTEVIDVDHGRQILRLKIAELYRRCCVHEAQAQIGKYNTNGVAGASELDEEVGFLTFEVQDNRLTLPLDCIREIRPMAGETVVGKGLEDRVLGMLNVRGKIIPVVSLSHRLGLGPASQFAEGVVIIMQSGNEQRGLLVDSVTSIVRSSASKVTDVSGFLPKGGRNGFMKMAKSALHVESQNLSSETLIVLDPMRVADLSTPSAPPIPTAP